MAGDGSTTARGYGYDHASRRKAWLPRVAAGEVDCWRCGERIMPDQAWDLGHDDKDRTITKGPEHRHRTGSCIGNRAAGARKGNANRQRKTASTLDTSRDW